MTADSDNERDGTPQSPLTTDGAHALAAAVTQIELALIEARTPVEQLGLLTERMANALGSLRAARAPDRVADPLYVRAGDEEFSIAQLQTDLYDSIRQLQVYDRMVQHLSHVQDFLSCVANQLASVAESGATVDRWDGLRAKLRERLISEVLNVTLADNVKARLLKPDGSYRRLKPGPRQKPLRSQFEFIRLANAHQGGRTERRSKALGFLSVSS